MKFFTFFLFLFLGAYCFSSFGMQGVYVGNGGDGILCKPSNENVLQGYFALDYILTLPSEKGSDGLTPVKSWNDSSMRIFSILKSKVPALASSFKDFSNLLYNSSHAESRLWEPAPFGLKELNDERITSQIPKNCKTDGAYKIIQAVIRQYEGFSGTQQGHYIYKYVPHFLSDLEKQTPLQYSMLMVHEWLWDLSTNVDRNRRINRFLHSVQIESMSPEKVVAELTGMGLVIPGVPSDAFDSEVWHGINLNEKVIRERYTSPYVLKNLGEMKIEQRERISKCPETWIGCNPGWTKPVITHDVFIENRFFTALSWSKSRSEFPIAVLSPELSNRDKTPIEGGFGQIQCRYVQEKEPNLECKVNHPKLFYSLFGLSSETPSSQWPTFRAHLTEEFFHAVVRGNRSISMIDADGRSYSIDVMTETALTTRFRWLP